jgi:hypothetical protein
MAVGGTAMIYREPSVGPELICPYCGLGAFIRHENWPGAPTVLECSCCGRDLQVNIVGFIPARTTSEEPPTYVCSEAPSPQIVQSIKVEDLGVLTCEDYESW